MGGLGTRILFERSQQEAWYQILQRRQQCRKNWANTELKMLQLGLASVLQPASSRNPHACKLLPSFDKLLTTPPWATKRGRGSAPRPKTSIDESLQVSGHESGIRRPAIASLPQPTQQTLGTTATTLPRRSCKNRPLCCVQGQPQ